MDEVEFIQRVLCRLDLPDQDVYPALARMRDARRENHRIHAALWHLALVFTTAVRQGLDVPPTGVNLWVLLRRQSQLWPDRELMELLNYLTGRGEDGGSGVGARRKPSGPRPARGHAQDPPLD